MLPDLQSKLHGKSLERNRCMRLSSMERLPRASSRWGHRPQSVPRISVVLLAASRNRKYMENTSLESSIIEKSKQRNLRFRRA